MPKHEHALSPSEFKPFVLSTKTPMSTHVFLLRFSYPGLDNDSGCKCGEYLSTRAVLNGEEIIRYYSPVSIPDDTGHIDLLVKVDTGKMSNVFAMMRVGDVLEIRGPISGFVCNAETMPKHMSLIAGGTGIAPCLQIIRQIIADKSDTKVTLLYGANDPSELVFRDELDSYENVKTIYTVDYVPNGVEWNGRVGYINKEMIQSHLPSPDDTFVVMCGTWMMMKTLRVTLEELGYADKMFVYG